METGNAIRLVEGDANVVYTITVKRGGAVEDLSGKTVTLYARDESSAGASNQVDGAAFTFTGDGSDGEGAVTFTAAHCTLASGKDLKGWWRLKIVDGADVEWSKRATFIIERNGMA